MCKYLAGALFVLLTFVTIGQADYDIHWWGTVTYGGSGVGGAYVYTDGASTYTYSISPVGRYHLNAGNGMVDGKHYDYIWANKSIGGEMKEGFIIVDAYYYDDVEKGNLDIALGDPSK